MSKEFRYNIGDCFKTRSGGLHKIIGRCIKENRASYNLICVEDNGKNVEHEKHMSIGIFQSTLDCFDYIPMQDVDNII
jgi:hypothetical protein